MRPFRGLLPAAAVSLTLLSACANTTTAGSLAGAPTSAGVSAPAGAGETPVLRVRHIGGFVGALTNLTRLPLVSVYDDGRVISEGPQVAIYPGPALPSLQVQMISPAAVQELIRKAVAAGVKNGVDLGQPGVTDVPTTRFTVVTDTGTQTVDAEALTEARPDDPALTATQKAARAKLAAFLQDLTGVSGGSVAAQPYTPERISAVVGPYTPDNDPALSAPPAVPWPGPALPGTSMGDGLELGCVDVDGAAVGALLDAAKSANARTPWASGGKQWSVTFRPMLPDETDCEALKAGTS